MWSGNCTDPKKVYESVLPNFSTWFEKVELEYFEKKKKTEIKAIQCAKWIAIDWNARQGSSRCYKLNQTWIDFPPWTIKFAKFWFKKEGSVFFHGPGQFQVKDPKWLTQARLTDRTTSATYKVVYEELEILKGKNGKPCNASSVYNFDQCVLDEIEKVSFHYKPKHVFHVLSQTGICGRVWLHHQRPFESGQNLQEQGKSKGSRKIIRKKICL